MTGISDPIFQFINENLFALVTLTLSVLIFPLVVSYIEKEYWSPLTRKKNVWKQFIGRNNSIRDCFKHYNSIENKSDVSPFAISMLNLLMTIYLLTQVFIIALINRIIEVQILPLIKSNYLIETYYGNYNIAFLLLIFLMLTVFSLPLIGFTAWMESTLKNVNYNNYEVKYTTTKSLYHICIFIAVYYIFLVSVFAYEVNYLLLIFVVLPILVLKHMYNDKKIATLNVKKLINNKYKANFPFIKISTMGAEHYSGRLKNVFDEESIKLIHNNKETIILWDAVAAISETDETEESQSQLSSFS